jgi:hypothetical protein
VRTPDHRQVALKRLGQAVCTRSDGSSRSTSCLEVEKPVWFPFVGPNQQHTGVSKSGLQRGLARLGTEGAEIIAAALREEAETERTH